MLLSKSLDSRSFCLVEPLRVGLDNYFFKLFSRTTWGIICLGRVETLTCVREWVREQRKRFSSWEEGCLAGLEANTRRKAGWLGYRRILGGRQVLPRRNCLVKPLLFLSHFLSDHLIYVRRIIVVPSLSLNNTNYFFLANQYLICSVLVRSWAHKKNYTD